MNITFDPDDIDALAEAVAARVLERLAPPVPVAAPSSWLNTTQAAAHLGFGKSTLEIWRMKGEGPPFAKAGGRVKYRLDELDAWQRGQS
jgi:hypothetical protein